MTLGKGFKFRLPTRTCDIVENCYTKVVEQRLSGTFGLLGEVAQISVEFVREV